MLFVCGECYLSNQVGLPLSGPLAYWCLPLFTMTELLKNTDFKIYFTIDHFPLYFISKMYETYNKQCNKDQDWHITDARAKTGHV